MVWIVPQGSTNHSIPELLIFLQELVCSGHYGKVPNSPSVFQDIYGNVPKSLLSQHIFLCLFLAFWEERGILLRIVQ